MAEQTFKSAGFFDFETEISDPQAAASGVPLAVIGASKSGPAFQPVYMGTGPAENVMANFISKFGEIDPENFGPYAVKAWFDNKSKACQYIRVLGAGANTTSAHFTTTNSYGIVNNAGFIIHHPNPNSATHGGNGIGSSVHNVSPSGQTSAPGTVYFLAAKHEIAANADIGLPHFTDNDSYRGVAESNGSPSADDVHLIRGMIFTTTASAIHIGDYDEVNIATPRDGIYAVSAHPSGSISTLTQGGKFKLIVSCSEGTAFANDDSKAGQKVFTGSLDPDSEYYIGKILNTDPLKLSTEQHLLYLDWPLTTAVAPVKTSANAIALMSGSSNASGNSLTDASSIGLNKWANLFGRFDTRYQAPRTPYMISQPFGSLEHDLFYFETLSDGSVDNTKYKISILNLKASTDPSDSYGTFDVVLRKFGDSDTAQQVVERFANCSINPDATNYIGKRIGDKKLSYNFDAPVERRRFTRKGVFPQRSNKIRVVVHPAVISKTVPSACLPFGFRGVPVLKTSPSIRENQSYTAAEAAPISLGDNPRLSAPVTDLSSSPSIAYTGSIVPPLPFRFKLAKDGALKTTGLSFIGQPGSGTNTDARLYWGIQFENQRVQLKPWDIGTSGESNNKIIDAYAKFQGIQKLGLLYTGSYADQFNNNKFSLSKVALVNQLTTAGALQHITGSAKKHMKDAAYIRNGKVDAGNYTVYDRILGKSRVTLATLLDKDKTKFNKFSGYTKFNSMFYGGFDGLNIFNKDILAMNDRASSTATGGLASNTITNGLSLTGSDNGTLMGANLENNVIQSYRSAIDILSDRYKSIHHVFAIPGIREPLITDYAMEKAKENQMALYVMDIPNYNTSGTRLYLGEAKTVSVPESVSKFISRNVDNNYAATYFPDVVTRDDINNQRNIKVPASIAAVGAISHSDHSKAGSVWFAPAGFSRGSLSNVTNTTSRLTTQDRDDLYEARINPIANFPADNPSMVEYKIWGQKTLQITKSALDRVNVRRMLLEVKRLVLQISRKLLFKRLGPNIRKRFISQLAPKLAFIQMNQGIEQFKIVMDDSNNTLSDEQQYRLNGTVLIVPTRTIEFVSVDFIIDPDGVTFK
jgi:hypothetical protein